MRHNQTYTIRGHEIDADYRLTAEGLVALFLNTFARLCAEHNLTAYELQPQQRSWVLTNLQMNLAAPTRPFWNSQVHFALTVAYCRGLRTDISFTARDENQLLASGASRWTIIDTVRRRPVIYPDLAQRFAWQAQDDSRPIGFATLSDLTQSAGAERFIVAPHDLDFNQHLATTRYLQWTLGIARKNLPIDHSLRSLQAKFMHEVKLGQEVEIKSVWRKNECRQRLLLLPERKPAMELQTQWRRRD
jgi:acyl-ACP thioesterase